MPDEENKNGNERSSIKKGFSSMDPEHQREIASEGGKQHMKKEKRMNGIRKKPVKPGEKVAKW